MKFKLFLEVNQAVVLIAVIALFSGYAGKASEIEENKAMVPYSSENAVENEGNTVEILDTPYEHNIKLWVNAYKTGTVTEKEAINGVKDAIRWEYLEDNLQYPTPSSKLRLLLKKDLLLPKGVEEFLPAGSKERDTLLNQACSELSQEVQKEKTEATPEMLEKYRQIDQAMARFNQQLANSEDKHADAINLMSINDRALVAIALQSECIECKKQINPEIFEKTAVSKFYEPMNIEQQNSFEERKKVWDEGMKTAKTPKIGWRSEGVNKKNMPNTAVSGADQQQSAFARFKAYLMNWNNNNEDTVSFSREAVDQGSVKE